MIHFKKICMIAIGLGLLWGGDALARRRHHHQRHPELGTDSPSHHSKKSSKPRHRHSSRSTPSRQYPRIWEREDLPNGTTAIRSYKPALYDGKIFSKVPESLAPLIVETSRADTVLAELKANHPLTDPVIVQGNKHSQRGRRK